MEAGANLAEGHYQVDTEDAAQLAPEVGDASALAYLVGGQRLSEEALRLGLMKPNPSHETIAVPTRVQKVVPISAMAISAKPRRAAAKMTGEHKTPAKMATPSHRVEWSRLYLESIEHLLWNPTWITATKSGTKLSIRERMKRLEGLEAPLHHALHLFVTLAPKSFVAWLASVDPGSNAIEVTSCQDWEHVVRGQLKPKPLSELCQPDIFIEGPGVQAAIEVKARSKSSLEQVVKYGALMMLRTPKTVAPMQRRLVYIAPCSDFARLWPRNAHADVEAVRSSLGSYSNAKLESAFRTYGTSIREVVTFLDCVQIVWRPVSDVRHRVAEELRQLCEKSLSSSDEVYRKLLSGFEAELQRTTFRFEQAAAAGQSKP